ncbi:hypothetical protein D3C87_1797260 [compost metagenome]
MKDQYNNPYGNQIRNKSYNCAKYVLQGVKYKTNQTVTPWFGPWKKSEHNRQSQIDKNKYYEYLNKIK